MAANPDSPSQCLNEAFAFRYIQTPMFVVADQRDSTLLALLGAGDTHPDSDERAYIDAYRDAVRRSLAVVPAYFATDNITHTALLSARFEFSAIDGRRLKDVIADWFFGRDEHVRLMGDPGEGLVPVSQP